MTPMVYHDYRIGVPKKGRYQEIMNSDWEGYEGSNTYNGLDPFTQDVAQHGFDQSIQIVLAPLAIQVFKLRK
jgi:1,4-alpha-glucan branching enzyme